MTPGENQFTILYDGWGLSRQPNGGEALNLLNFLAHLSPEVHPVVALPGPSPAWFPPGIAVSIHPCSGSGWGNLVWEQRILPYLARRFNARLLHLNNPGTALFTSTPCVASPSGYDPVHTRLSDSVIPAGSSSPPAPPEPRVLSDRLREAIAQGALTRLGGLLWPEDLPTPDVAAPVYRLPPVVHPVFTASSAKPNGSLPLDLPESYILYHGPGSGEDIMLLLDSWSWAAGPIGDNYPLLVSGFDPGARRRLEQQLDEAGLGKTVRVLPELSPGALSAIYRSSAAIFHPVALPVWGGPVRNALACGRPVVAADTLFARSIVGSAAYLANANDPRSLGAALITVAIEESVAGQLSLSAQERAAGWSSAKFSQQLWEAYQSAVAKR